jgi:hypothetical protein
MALINGNITYSSKLSNGNIRRQAGAIVCEACEQPINADNFGRVELENRMSGRGLHEVILCIRCCDGRPTIGIARQRFLIEHDLMK